MCWINVTWMYVVVYLTAVSATSNSNATLEENRQPRVSGHIVKLYSGPKEVPFYCDGEGFKSDSSDCSVFYRCVKAGEERFTVFRFQCGPGTIYDPDTEVCNHPRSTRRLECYGFVKPESDSHHENDIEFLPPNELPIPMTTNTINKPGISDKLYQTTAAPWQIQTTNKLEHSVPSLSRPIYSQKHKENKKKDGICLTDGFVGDFENCRTFYRCVNNGHGGFIRYEFSCSETTVWDEEAQSCNHPPLVKSRRCGRITDDENENFTLQPPNNFGSRLPEVTLKPDHIQLANNNSDKIYLPPHSEQPIQQIHVQTTLHPILISADQAQDQKQSYGINDQVYDEPISTTSTQRPTEKTTTQSNQNTDTKCKSSGFIGDPEDCRKFYRCVDNGQGGYTVYEFTCGEGTAWDQSIEGCNHDWAVKDCQGQTGQTQAEKTSTTPKPTSSTSEDSNNEGPPSTSTNAPTASETSTASSNSDTVCKYNGFIGDENDCKKFYRCVDNGNGGYTKYEFTCGEGTVWDPEIDSCNHAWAVSKCGGSSNTDYNKETVTPSTSSAPTTTQNNDIDQTTKHEIEQSSTTEQTSTKPSPNQTCAQEGFYADDNDCKKFYRCVDNGNGGYTKYEFSCGDGTVWDQEIHSCNHPSSSKSCESSTSVSSSTTVVETNEETTVQSQLSTESDDNENPTKKPETSPDCNAEGFYGNPKDCKKFYRCVDNGQGGYTKYEFSCGDGTIWDQNVQACNHDTSNGKCSPSNQSEYSTISSAPDNTQETTEGTQTTPSTGNDGHCDSEGFYANPNNCKKFYRCVSDGQGGFTKYDFDCGDGTVWVQEIQACDHDNDIKNCSNQNSPQENQNVEKPTDSTEQTSVVSQSQTMSDEQPVENEPSSTASEECKSEGFYANENDCHKFYRCVDNGNDGYTRYDFTCGEGTAWDSNIQSCDHESNVESCRQNSQGVTQGASNEPIADEYQTTQGTTTTSTSSSSTNSQPCNGTNNSSENPPTESSNSDEGTTSTTTTTTENSQETKEDECTEEGFYGNSQDCTKFYRCVDDGKGGLTKYDFTCGEGTIWDQDVTTCNHPQDVNNPSCTSNSNSSSSTPPSSDQGSTQSSNETDPQSSSTTSTTESQSSNSSSDCSQETSSKKPESSKVTCTKEGFYADPDDCKKFYRCVDWDGSGEKFSVFHFECGEGTIWDPQLDTCNYEDSVYPPRDCSGSQSQTESNEDNKTTSQATTEKESTTPITTESTTNSEQTTSQESTTTEKQTTTSEASTEGTTTTEKQSTTTEQTTTQETTTTEKQSTTSEPSTTQGTTTEQTTTQDTTTTEKQSTTTEQITTQDTTTTEKQSTTTEQTTTQDTTTTEKQSTTTEQTTTQDTTTTEKQSTTTEQTSTQDTTTTEKQSTTTEAQSTTTEMTTQQSTEGTTQQTTESSQDSTTTEQYTTTEQSHQSKDCPDTEDDQYIFVCPSGFRRHPKYCNMFYQCSEDNDTHEIKVATFTCPNSTIYDESQNQCVEEDKAEEKCDGEMAQKRRVKRLEVNSREPLIIGTQRHSCPSIGHYPFEKENECSSAFLKCERSKNGSIRGFINRCPDNYIYWSVSRRCEPKGYLLNCKNTTSRWSGRWEIPIEKNNIAH